METGRGLVEAAGRAISSFMVGGIVAHTSAGRLLESDPEWHDVEVVHTTHTH